MKKRIISILLTVVMIMSLAMSVGMGALAAAVELKVGTTYPSTTYGTILNDSDIGLISTDAANPGIVSKTTQTQNGITVTATVAENKRSVDVAYSGTPTQEGLTSFTVKYSVGGTEKSYDVVFNVTKHVVEPYAPEILSAEPRNLNQTFKKSDSEVVFSVSASGNGTISYRWEVDGTEVSSENKITIVPEDMTVGNHTVKCTVSNTIDNTSKLSDVEWKVVIEKSAKPEIKSKESSATIDGTGAVDFKVTAEGEGLKYQWYMLSGTKKQAVEDGTYGIMEYSGATTEKLTIKCTMAPKNVSTKFICEVTNSEGLTASTGEYILNISEDPNAEKVQKIEVTAKPSKTDYIVGETLDQSGMKLTVTTGKGTEEITSGFVCSPLYLEEEGSQTITVSYGGKTTSFTVNVSEAPHEHEWSEWRVEGKEPLLRVVRDCTAGDDCTAQEILSKDSFMAQYPTIAHKLGLTEDKSDSNKTDKDSDSDKEENTTNKADNKTTTDNKGESKKSSNTVLWIIIIIAVILLAGVVYYYIKVYRKPYKKPNTNKTNNRNK